MPKVLFSRLERIFLNPKVLSSVYSALECPIFTIFPLDCPANIVNHAEVLRYGHQFVEHVEHLNVE